MMPIVFCASFVPWPSEYAAAERSWPRRKTRSTRRGEARRKSQKMMIVRIQATTRPISGARMMKISVFVHPEGLIAANPARATAAPAYPPMSACEELVGRPKYQVMRSHTMAPKRPPKITPNVTTWTSIIPLPIVFATAVPKPNAATKLKKAAHTTACPGERTRVDTTVAIEFAAS